MNHEQLRIGRPKLKTKGFSTYHIAIFELILLKKTNREINQIMAYSKRSHVVVDHSRKVMYKLLALENLSKKDKSEQVIYTRTYCFWWRKLLSKHQNALLRVAIEPQYY